MMYVLVFTYYLKWLNCVVILAGYHGKDGPLIVSDVRSTLVGDAFVQAGVEAGYKSLDINGESQDGVCL